MVMYANEFKTKENQKLAEIQKLTATYSCMYAFLYLMSFSNASFIILPLVTGIQPPVELTLCMPSIS